MLFSKELLLSLGFASGILITSYVIYKGMIFVADKVAFPEENLEEKKDGCKNTKKFPCSINEIPMYPNSNQQIIVESFPVRGE